jgi:hypothetical protein
MFVDIISITQSPDSVTIKERWTGGKGRCLNLFWKGLAHGVDVNGVESMCISLKSGDTIDIACDHGKQAFTYIDIPKELMMKRLSHYTSDLHGASSFYA